MTSTPTPTLLAIDTATPRVSVAIWRDGRVVASRRSDEGRRHGELLAPAIQAAVAEAGVTMTDLHAVAVDVGPGLFTGLRVGVATAKALASALGVPAIAVTSLEVLAHRSREPERPVVAVVDARRHEVFRAIYVPAGAGPAETHPAAVMTPADLAAELGRLGHDVVAVGDGARRYADVIAGPNVEVAGPDEAYPDAAVGAEIAAVRLAAGAATDSAGLHAFYLRPADVRIGWATAGMAPPAAPGPTPTPVGTAGDG